MCHFSSESLAIFFLLQLRSEFVFVSRLSRKTQMRETKPAEKKRAGITSAEVIEGYGRRKERERKVMQDNGISSNKCNPFFHVELYCIMCYIVTSGSE